MRKGKRTRQQNRTSSRAQRSAKRFPARFDVVARIQGPDTEGMYPERYGGWKRAGRSEMQVRRGKGLDDDPGATVQGDPNRSGSQGSGQADRRGMLDKPRMTPTQG